MRRGWIATLMVFLILAPVRAQDDPDPSVEEQSAASETEASTNDSDRDKSEESRSNRLDEFVPTQEISEDNSVSFPVDI